MRIKHVYSIVNCLNYDLKKIKKCVYVCIYSRYRVTNTIYIIYGGDQEIHRKLDILDTSVLFDYISIFTTLSQDVDSLLRKKGVASDLIQIQYIEYQEPANTLGVKPCFLMRLQDFDAERARRRYNGILVDIDREEVIN